MNLKDYIKEKETNENPEDKIIDFFKNNKNVKDSDIHDFAEKEGIDPHKFEEIIYSLLTAFWNKGKYNEDGRPAVNISELTKGIEIEKEHTDNEMIAKRIAQDHLSEIPDYYTRLIKMENDAKKDMNEISLVDIFDKD